MVHRPTDRPLSRRGLLLAAGGVLTAPAVAQSPQALVDYHAHIDAVGTLEALLEISRSKGVKFGVVEHAGNREKHRYRGLLGSDQDLEGYIARLEGKPCFKGIQAEGLDWMKSFSKRAVARLDYVLSDALTFPEKDGSLVRLWTPEARIDDPRDFMERYTAFNVQVIESEPIDILANPLFLPEALEKQADSLWTQERMQRIARAAAANRVAIEINSRYRLPSPKFLKLARAAGVRFSFGSNAHGPAVGSLDYGREMVKELGLTGRDLFSPAPAGRKPVQVRAPR